MKIPARCKPLGYNYCAMFQFKTERLDLSITMILIKAQSHMNSAENQPVEIIGFF